jgi:hypothetical protein
MGKAKSICSITKASGAVRLLAWTDDLTMAMKIEMRKLVLESHAIPESIGQKVVGEQGRN